MEGSKLDILGHVEAIRAAVAHDLEALEQYRQQLEGERRQLESERRLFEVEKRALRDRIGRGQGLVTPLNGDVVELNVGGTHFTTSLATLTSDPSSTLAQLFQQPAAIPLDADGRFFLDYGGQPFAYLLKYLRGEKFFVKKGDPIVAEVYSLAHRLNLSGFIRTIEDTLRGMRSVSAQPHREGSPAAAAVQQQQPSPRGNIPSAAEAAAAALPALSRSRSPQPRMQSPLRIRQASPQLRAQQVAAPRLHPAAGGPHAAADGGGDDDPLALMSPSVRDPLRRALERQRSKQALQDGATALQHIQQQEDLTRAASLWETHWQTLSG